MFEEEFDKHRDDCKNSKCVCKQVKKIAEAQDAVAGTGDCDVSCKQSIRDLVSPTTTSGNDTIPFILYCKCKPFIGSGVIQGTTSNNGGTRPAFTCIQTPIYRVKKVDKDCCATLELLLPVSMGGGTPGPREDTVCSYFPGEAIAAFQRTGICIKVDLCDFTAISCLDPVRARSVADFNMGAMGRSSHKED
ncbi:spore coat protein [Halalkalibacillus sediminis]|uniref:Spore coat protein n=1 Tax=Halalkalibacillus sediminis TaxID=2018042 RepID=A0A2I0QSY5_9BACI|nr:CotY/CotZ family spore coat protein [Halalkalibacillus sediminis]PKR77452.1 spore coat protein [Halalkalibacillus sediminis]